ncbi:non-specific lipid transfer protein GPI-anchored 9-like [Primulina eburnea]|uniref:non-specific lipid transfer protein GPI-anchored 9-like n=1 Tax=Primulina eburnea TaxID=1245227 RepID=UPI003C6C0D62
MAISNSFLLFFLLSCSWVFVGFGQGQGDTLPCVQKLLPCQPYMKVDSPPASCCVPMKQLVADDKACLCKVINNPGILQSLNITKTDAVNLAKNCGASADLSVCNKIVIPSPGSTPSAPSNGTTPSPPPKSAASAASFHHVAAYLSLPVAVLIFTKSSN